MDQLRDNGNSNGNGNGKRYGNTNKSDATDATDAGALTARCEAGEGVAVR